MRGTHTIVFRAAVNTVSSLLTGAAVLAGTIAVPYLNLVAPAGDISLSALNPASERTLVLHDSAGKKFAHRGGCVAEPVKLSEVPPHLIDALLSMEDRRFYSHLGVDPIGVLRAALENRAAGRIVQGGSTITQQLVKFSLLSSDRTLERKKKEAWLALALELSLSKNEILERYLSSAYFGRGCYGLRAAAKEYYKSSVSDLSLQQAAYLVALLKSPTYLVENPKAAEERAETVFNAMLANGKLSPSQRSGLEPEKPHLDEGRPTGSYYADWVAGTLQVPHTGDYSPLPVHTWFDRDLQRLADNAVDTVLDNEGEKRHARQAAMVVMRPDGRVLAMVGGRSHADSQFNRAVQARRQPGSSFKLFVYLAALRGGLKTNGAVSDRPISIGDYRPQNFDQRYRGRVSVERAFASSINTVAISLSEGVGRKPVIDAAHDLGISSPMKAQPSLALGVFEVSLLELTSAYAAVAAGAYPIKPWAISGFEDHEAFSAPPSDSGKWRLDEQEDLLTLLRATVEKGSGRRARLPIAAYGKTGTSQEYRDAWFIGFAGNLVVGVWVGNDDFTPMKRVTGGSLPAEIWATFMREGIEADREFDQDLPQIASFPAEQREDRPEVQLASGVTTPKAAAARQQPSRKSTRVRRVERFEFLERRAAPRSKRRGLLGRLFR
jgi:penicillin-binding protein 1A